MAAFRVHTRDWYFSKSDTQDYCKKLEGRAISFFYPFMPNDVRGYLERVCESEKEKIGALQAVAWRGEAAGAAANYERLSGLTNLHMMARGRRKREGREKGLA